MTKFPFVDTGRPKIFLTFFSAFKWSRDTRCDAAKRSADTKSPKKPSRPVTSHAFLSTRIGSLKKSFFAHEKKVFLTWVNDLTFSASSFHSLGRPECIASAWNATTRSSQKASRASAWRKLLFRQHVFSSIHDIEIKWPKRFRENCDGQERKYFKCSLSNSLNSSREPQSPIGVNADKIARSNRSFAAYDMTS